MTATQVFAIVEIMGRRQRAGAISDVRLGGATLLRVEHPTRTTEAGEPVCEYYAPQALFAIRPCTRDEAEQVAAWAWAGGAQPLELQSYQSVCELDDDDDDDDPAHDEAWDEDGRYIP